MMGSKEERSATILLVEDDPGDRELTCRALKDGHFRNDVRVVENGEAALDYLFRRGEFADPARSPRPDLVLLDLNLPKIDGREVLRQIREDSRLKTIAVVVLTTSRQEEDILRSYGLGANSYIPKPVDWEHFLRAVSSLEEYWFRVVKLPPSID